ncbi:hypothetical protein CDEST_13429 [Colletotrichum destructivum]|uniref:Uncharacterized protein n=1 Tax=Colletotrichum destructivum TaxID=34406 RepID=A0AAX4IYX3_9PEZI|nr:hypothetical protein CDEST_13429 [Colletotrichum destructivum]
MTVGAPSLASSAASHEVPVPIPLIVSIRGREQLLLTWRTRDAKTRHEGRSQSTWHKNAKTQALQPLYGGSVSPFLSLLPLPPSLLAHRALSWIAKTTGQDAGKLGICLFSVLATWRAWALRGTPRTAGRTAGHVHYLPTHAATVATVFDCSAVSLCTVYSLQGARIVQGCNSFRSTVA